MLRPSACAIFVASANTFITTRSPGPVRLEPGAISSLSTCASILICATLAPIVRPCEEHLCHAPPEGPLQDGGPDGHRWNGADRSVTIAMHGFGLQPSVPVDYTQLDGGQNLRHAAASR